MIRIENEYQIDTYMDYIPSENSILNLDLDIFATELDHIPSEKKVKIIKKGVSKNHAHILLAAFTSFTR